ncbi:putative multi-sensor hybrid histidine kinase [Roseibium sp. TrichSKD4]|uniref:sensor histidine kinase n=1 Tax=Roseibium sp. TrichSKD4 TaxID=744980 RepID=UPI0001E56AAA|nr:sensor histidine kinase [Roseibium sp. TrichSKD4]EFO31135.1 putative multi-sensor hybrid histidine kinase [Roseibium sp. TrichSKD4]
MNGAPKLNIRQRLWIALGLLASSTLFVGGVAWFSLDRANIGLETLHQQTLSEVARVLRLSRQSSDIAASAPFLLSYPSAYLIEKEGKSLAQTLQQVADDWHSVGAEPNFEVAAFHDEINAAISAMKTAIEELAVSAEALTVEREATETLAKRLGGGKCLLQPGNQTLNRRCGTS